MKDMRFIEIMTRDKKVTLVNVDQIVHIRKVTEGAFLKFSTDGGLTTTTSYEEIKEMIEKSAESIYNNPGVKFEC
jgi:Flp pilus assembly CpaE family ATPase